MRYFSGLKRSIDVQYFSEPIVIMRVHYLNHVGHYDETYQKVWSLSPREVEIYDITAHGCCGNL